MQYTIYFNNRPVFLLDNPAQEIIRYMDKDHVLFVNQFTPGVLTDTIAQIRSGQADAVVFHHPDLEALKEAFWQHFTVLQAAGGLVINEKEEALCIFRLGRWDLPKGKLDAGESLEECAVREVEEETGLRGIRLDQLLTVTYHTYIREGLDHLKETYWYRMHASWDGPLTAQKEEDITQAEWLNKQMLPMVLKNTYPAIRDVLDFWTTQNGQTDQPSSTGD